MKTGLPATPYAAEAPAESVKHRRAPQEYRHERLGNLFREHQTRLLRFLSIRLGSKLEALDALQIVFMRLLQRSASLHEENLVSLVYVCARNVAIDLVRQRRRRVSGLLEEGQDMEVADERPGPDRQVQDRERLELLMALVEELPPKCRRAFVSYKLQGLEYAEIAGEMGVTESMVRKYVLKALAYCSARFAQLQS